MRLGADVKVDLRTKELKEATDRGLCRALSKFGAYTRRRARGSIRKRKKISAPGAAPSSHTGALKNGILFAVERERLTCVIGAMATKSTAPATLEHGGVGLDGNYYRPRPFMTPAFEREIDSSLRKVFTDCVKK